MKPKVFTLTTHTINAEKKRDTYALELSQPTFKKGLLAHCDNEVFTLFFFGCVY